MMPPVSRPRGRGGASIGPREHPLLVKRRLFARGRVDRILLQMTLVPAMPTITRPDATRITFTIPTFPLPSGAASFGPAGGGTFWDEATSPAPYCSQFTVLRQENEGSPLHGQVDRKRAVI